MPIIHIELPDDAKEIVLKAQTEIKIKKKLGKYSQQSTIINIIREYGKFKKDSA